jgi:hypothetical protein
VRGTITGLHASNDNILVRWEDGNTEQERSYTSNVYVRPEVADQYAVLGQALDQAQKQFDSFVEKHSLDAKEEIEKQMNKKLEDA